MKVGGKRRLIIPAAMAYGDQSPSPDIPANSALVFDIELINLK
jgi:peptidylprolyl isomerase